jgi:hypothetical protein
MQSRILGIGRLTAGLLMTAGVAACSLDTQEPPSSLIGPSGSSQQVFVTASPDRFDHNGQSQSTVTVSVRNELGEPVAGQRVSVGVSTGTASTPDVVTGSGGQASFTVTAPPLSTPAPSVSVFATPFGVDAGSALTRVATIALTGPVKNATAPSPSIVIVPESPIQGQVVVFDASATRDEDGPCTGCTYTWEIFPAEAVANPAASGTNPFLQTTFNVLGTTPIGVVVRVTVRDIAGSSGTTQLAVTVAPPPAGP